MGPNGLPVWFCNRLECLLVLNGPVSPSGVTDPLYRKSNFVMVASSKICVCSSVLSVAPQLLWLLQHVMTIIEDEGFSWAVDDSWGFAPNQMHSGGATRNVATWRMMIGGADLVTLGFPAVFQFLGLKSSLFLHFPISLIISVSEFSPSFSLFYLCYHSDSAPITPILLQSLLGESPFPACAAYFEGTFFFFAFCFFLLIICL